DKAAVVELLDRPVIREPRFRDAVAAIHTGDLAGLRRLLDAHPALLRARAKEPACHPRDYFRDPKLFWFVANNPTLRAPMPANIREIAREMIDRGVEAEDLDYTLELAMTSSAAREQGHQAGLVSLLMESGARATPQAIVVTLAHREIEPIEALLARGLTWSAPIAAGLGRADRLAALLAHASPADRRTALGLAVINAQFDTARLCLDAGADPNALLPVHAHCTPLHTATLNDDVPMLELLISRGAKPDARDKLFRSTPLGWAVHNRKRNAE